MIPITFLLLSLVAVPSAPSQEMYVDVKVKVPASGWYVLVSVNSDLRGSLDALKRAAPQPVGPYPSEEMCRLAARVLVPSDRQFWPAAEKDAADQRGKEAAALLEKKVEAELAEIRARPLAQRSNKTFWLSDGSGTYFDKAGKEMVGRSGTWISAVIDAIPIADAFIADSGCMHVRQ